jgi:ligand-binding sensor domain-containing protein
MTLPALGKTINVGPGTRQGLWYSLSARDGLPYNIYDILQDRDGRLWMAAGWDEVGVCCFDGSQFTFFTTADGLPSNMVLGLLQDRHGHLWFNGTF